jgi:hypothetical protein
MTLSWCLISWLGALSLRLAWRAWLWHKIDQPYTPREFVADAVSLFVGAVLLASLYYIGKLMLLY